MASKQEIREEILILKDTQASEDAKASAACALGNWATREASNPLAVEAEGGLPLLVQLLQEGGGEAQRNAAYALWALAKKGNELARKGNEQVTRALVACGGQEALEALARDPTYHWDEKRGTGPLEYAEMALEDLPELSHGLGRRHFQRQVMDLECGLDECQAAEQLGTWAARSDENRVSISRVHGGEALLALVVNGSDDAKWHAARALRNLANNQEAKENILKADGIAVLTRLAEHGKRKVKKAAREALHVLSMVDAQRNPAAVADAKPPEKEASPTAIPTGEGTRVAMFSARFDGGPVEMTLRLTRPMCGIFSFFSTVCCLVFETTVALQSPLNVLRKFRQVFSILRDHKYDVLMVAADAGDSFGDLTTEYLRET